MRHGSGLVFGVFGHHSTKELQHIPCDIPPMIDALQLQHLSQHRIQYTFPYILSSGLGVSKLRVSFHLPRDVHTLFPFMSCGTGQKPEVTISTPIISKKHTNKSLLKLSYIDGLQNWNTSTVTNICSCLAHKNRIHMHPLRQLIQHESKSRISNQQPPSLHETLHQQKTQHRLGNSL